MLRNILFAAALLAFSGLAVSASFNCTGGGALPNTCHAVTDPAPTNTIQPVTCKVYGPIAGTSFVMASGPVSGLAGGLFCNILLPTMAAGTITIAVSWVGTDGVESPKSVDYVFTNVIPVVLTPLAKPPNPRITNP